MEKADFLNIIDEIGTCEDEVQRRELLAGMRDDVSAIFDSNSDLTEKNTNLEADNESLRAANMKLFLRVGDSSKTPEETLKDKTGIDNQPRERLKFNDLFDEKGGIK